MAQAALESQGYCLLAGLTVNMDLQFCMSVSTYVLGLATGNVMLVTDTKKAAANVT